MPQGHTPAQKPQPMQYLGSTNTAPSGESNVAPTGQTWAQGECFQLLQMWTEMNLLLDLKIQERI